jgi:hypothetical protein
VHDISALEGLGIASVFVASTEFIDAAQAQAGALGFDPVGVFVPHPIQDRSDAEVRDLADAAVEEILRALTTNNDCSMRTSL